jgi:hypothetical protein
MKRSIIVLAIFAAAAFGAYRWYSHSYAPVKQYEAFAEEMLRRHYDRAAQMTDGLTADALAQSGSQEKVLAGPQTFQTLFPSRFKIESRTVAADGTLSMRVVQTVLFNPPGVESGLRPAMYATMRQAVTMRRVGSGWKIAAFENSVEKVDSLTTR